MSERINLDDPNADLFGMNDEISDEEMAFNQIFDKNPDRVAAISDLWYDDMVAEIDKAGLSGDAKNEMIFSMTANAVLDMIGDAVLTDVGLEVSFSFDMFLGVSLTNKRFNVNLFDEHHKALMGIEREEFPDEDTYLNAVDEFEEQWWDIPQPLLDKRTPNDAIRETLQKYGLTE